MFLHRGPLSPEGPDEPVGGPPSEGHSEEGPPEEGHSGAPSRPSRGTPPTSGASSRDSGPPGDEVGAAFVEGPAGGPVEDDQPGSFFGDASPQSMGPPSREMSLNEEDYAFYRERCAVELQLLVQQTGDSELQNEAEEELEHL